MANRAEYLLTIEEGSYDPKRLYSREVLDTWASMGSLVVNRGTALYNAGSLVRIDCKGPLRDRMVYVLETYQVDNSRRKFIEWDTVTSDNVDGLYAAQDGVMLPYFMTLKSKWMSDFDPTPGFLPFSDEDVQVDNGDVIIDDGELELILVDIGFPFVTFQDVEFSKAEIQRVCIKPAMQRFFTFFPIVDEQPGYEIGAVGSEFLVEFPPNAYACVPYYTTPGGAMAMNGAGNPFTFYNEQLMSGGRGMGFGAGGLGKGVRYTGKMNPGFVGLEQRSAWLDKLAVQQGYLNYFRREKYKRKKIDGKLYAYGFTTIGGNLNFKWLKNSNDWDDIPFELLEPVARPMAKSAVLQQFGMLRQLVKADIAGQLDATVLTNQRKEYEENLKPILNSAGVYGSMAIGRGGG